jgi:hypothetical protein
LGPVGTRILNDYGNNLGYSVSMSITAPFLANNLLEHLEEQDQLLVIPDEVDAKLLPELLYLFAIGCILGVALITCRPATSTSCPPATPGTKGTAAIPVARSKEEIREGQSKVWEPPTAAETSLPHPALDRGCWASKTREGGGL